MASLAATNGKRCSCTEKALLQAIVDSLSGAAWFEDENGECVVSNTLAEGMPQTDIGHSFVENGLIVVDNVTYRSCATNIPYKKRLVLKELVLLDGCSAKIRASTQRLKAILVENE